MESLCIGSRISVTGDSATVKYIGTVPPTKGEWLGVEWDDPTRGRHDGTKDGVAYFKCRHKTSGSFIRATKANFGVSICDAITDRYTLPTESGDSHMNDMYLGNIKIMKKIETVGMDQVQKQFGKLNQLKQIILRDQIISSAGTVGQLATLTPSLVELNLSKNLISSWDTVCDIVKQLPCLKVLNLSENIMQVTDKALSQPEVFANIDTMVLNKCSLSWEELLTCTTMWPQVTELHIEANNMTHLSPPGDKLNHVKLLHLSGNPLNSWHEVQQLSQLPMLSCLLIKECELSDLFIKPGDFKQLKELFLDRNKYESVHDLNPLNNLPEFIELHFRKNPALNQDRYDAIHDIIVAKIKRLQRLDRLSVTQQSRFTAEMDYLRKYGVEWRESGGHQDPERNQPSQEFIENHPRYMELIAEHGAPDDKQFMKMSSALKGNLLELIIEAPVKPDFKPVTKKLPKSMSIGSLKLLIQKLTKIEIRNQRLVYISKENPNLIVTLHRDRETLDDVSIEPGDVIRVMKPKKGLNYIDTAEHDKTMYRMIYGDK
uniref:tubulin-specific chaperone E-like isoform X1 n=1 Tax=Ciona intestinalis TaxID=7719 RepID=UPI000180D1C0|nr:tubulin-specific chaperone E-like isoform X1 [Ciona intestinalis]|eukprot:XP_009858327.1 tubulin-specific chaperone E-like isoform X1 [Ciona intestinalis]